MVIGKRKDSKNEDEQTLGERIRREGSQTRQDKSISLSEI